MIDEYPILAVAAALARGTTRMHGLAELFRQPRAQERLDSRHQLRAEPAAHVLGPHADLVLRNDERAREGGPHPERCLRARPHFERAVGLEPRRDPVRLERMMELGLGFVELLQRHLVGLGRSDFVERRRQRIRFSNRLARGGDGIHVVLAWRDLEVDPR